MSASSNSPTASKGEAAAVRAVASVIAEHPFLHGLKPEHLCQLADSAMRVRYETSELIFREGDPANRFYLIEQGQVSLEHAQADEPMKGFYLRYIGRRSRKAEAAIGLINLIYPPAELRAGNLARYEQIVRLKLLPRTAACLSADTA